MEDRAHKSVMQISLYILYIYIHVYTHIYMYMSIHAYTILVTELLRVTVHDHYEFYTTYGFIYVYKIGMHKTLQVHLCNKCDCTNNLVFVLCSDN